jgi:hypothetical protein
MNFVRHLRPQAWRATGRGLVAGLMLLAAASAFAAGAEVGTTWAQLSAEQRDALAPLKADWSGIDAVRKQKWLEVAGRFRTLPAEERGRIQARMADWARMTPTERGRARLQFQEAQQLSPEERAARWQAYQALPEPERTQLVQQAKQPAKPASTVADIGRSARPAAAEASAAKRNEVTTKLAPPSRAVTPASVQGKPGATTTSIAKRPTPPAHQQAGLPKIAATPTFVDPATLLPRRGPQAAAVRASASAVELDDQP